MKIGWHPNSKNPRKAGIRLRCLYPMSELKKRGLNIEYFDIKSPKNYQVVIVDAWSFFIKPIERSKELLNSLKIFSRHGGRIIIDNCDNPFYTQRVPPYWEQHLQYLQTALQLADHWIVCSSALAEELTKNTNITPQKLTVIGDPIEPIIKAQEDSIIKSILSWKRKLAVLKLITYRYKLFSHIKKGATPIVWYGNHGVQFAEGGMFDILSISDYLEKTHKKHPLVLGVISNHFPKFKELEKKLNIPTLYLEWDRTTFISALKLHKLAVIPIQPNPFTHCKSNNRLLFALYHGLGVVADKIPSYTEFERMCKLDNWEEGFEEYINHPEILEKNLNDAQVYIEKHWTLKNIADQWHDAIIFTYQANKSLDNIR